MRSVQSRFSIRVVVLLLLAVSILLGACSRPYDAELETPGLPDTEAGENQHDCRELLPSMTDETISAWNEPHYVCVPGDGRADPARLFVFFPGTGATPGLYTHLMNAAAQAGLYVIGLRYPNDKSVNLQLCPRDDDPGCHEKIRWEITQGVDRSIHVDVDRTNSIEGRLTSALRFLAGTNPEERWADFLNEQAEIDWSRIVVAGHSQGGGHAVYLAREHLVDRAIAFAWVDVRRGELAGWLESKPSITPPEAYYLFWHRDDDPVARYQGLLAENLAIEQFGQPVIVDTSAPPYDGTHALVATGVPPDGERAHNVHAVDRALSFDSAGQPTYRLAWEYLLNHGVEDREAHKGEVEPLMTGKAVEIGMPGIGYIDPEFLPQENLIAYTDGDRQAWLAQIDPSNGEFLSVDGRDILIDQDLTPLSISFNGPEFGLSTEGWSLYYTKEFEGVPQIWQANLKGDSILRSPITSDDEARVSVLASKHETLESVHLLYALNGFSPVAGSIGWLSVADPEGSETAVDRIDRGARWIEGTAMFTYVQQTGPDAGQVVLYDTGSNTGRTITAGAGIQSYPYGWHAPEVGGLLVLAISDQSRIEVYRDSGTDRWETYTVLEIPEAAENAIIGSPETFVAGGQSYITLVTKSTRGYSESEVWVWGLGTGEEQYALRCEDGLGSVIRTDPESYLGAEQVFVYYNVVQDRGSGRHEVSLYKCDTGIVS